MKLALVDYNKGQMPKTIKEALELCTIYSRKDIEEYLEQNPEGVHKVNTSGYVFGFCEKEHQEEIQKRLEVNWGGQREGAGRPTTGRVKKNIYVTEEEFGKVKSFIEELRKLKGGGEFK